MSGDPVTNTCNIMQVMGLIRCSVKTVPQIHCSLCTLTMNILNFKLFWTLYLIHSG